MIKLYAVGTEFSGSGASLPRVGHFIKYSKDNQQLRTYTLI